MHIGFIGLGDQGGPMAQRILERGFDLSVWARRADICQKWKAMGAKVAVDPVALAADSDLLCLCVTGDGDVRDLVLRSGLLDVMRPGSMIAIHSTINPDTCRELAATAAPLGVTILDMPVSGSGHAALAGTLLVMTGGEGRALDRMRPVLECYAGTIVPMGAVGSAMHAKLVNNLLAVVNIGQAFRALMLGRSVGVDPHALRAAIRAGTGRSFAMDLIARLQLPARAEHVRAILAKDVALAIESVPKDERQYWQCLADVGLDALARLSSGEVAVLPERERVDVASGSR